MNKEEIERTIKILDEEIDKCGCEPRGYEDAMCFDCQFKFKIIKELKYLQSQLDKSNNKIEKIKEYLRSKHFEGNFQSTNKKDILSIIDGSDE